MKQVSHRIPSGASDEDFCPSHSYSSPMRFCQREPRRKAFFLINSSAVIKPTVLCDFIIRTFATLPICTYQPQPNRFHSCSSTSQPTLPSFPKLSSAASACHSFSRDPAGSSLTPPKLLVLKSIALCPSQEANGGRRGRKPGFFFPTLCQVSMWNIFRLSP